MRLTFRLGVELLPHHYFVQTDVKRKAKKKIARTHQLYVNSESCCQTVKVHCKRKVRFQDRKRQTGSRNTEGSLKYLKT